MNVLHTILTIIFILVCVALSILVLMQEGKQQGLSGAIAGGAETFFGKSKGRTMEQKLVKITRVCAVIFFVLTMATTLVLLFLR